MPELTSFAHCAEVASDRAHTDVAPAFGQPCAQVTALRLDGDRGLVKVRGELDLDNSEQLGGALGEALSRSVRGIDLDLEDVSFCDCSALNTLLDVRHRALKQTKTVALLSTSTVVDRLLALTETRTLFADPGPDGPSTVPAAAAEVAPGTPEP